MSEKGLFRLIPDFYTSIKQSRHGQYMLFPKGGEQK